jgi:ketosteroid isomerase-like protein
MASSGEATVRAAYQASNRRDLGGLVARMHEDAEIKPVLGANFAANVYLGHDGVAQWQDDLRAEWDSFHASVEEVIDRGDRLLCVVRISARGRASGAFIDGELFDLWTVREGRLAGLEGFTDRSAAVRALEGT